MPLYNVERFCNYLKEYEFGGHYTGLLFEGHFGYIHCEGVVLNWMNVIRDPIDRMISMFYFLRLKTRWGLSEGRLKDMDRPPQVMTTTILIFFFALNSFSFFSGMVPQGFDDVYSFGRPGMQLFPMGPSEAADQLLLRPGLGVPAGRQSAGLSNGQGEH